MIAVRVNAGRLHVQSPTIKPRRGKVTRCGESLRPPRVVTVVDDPDAVPPEDRCHKCFVGSARKGDPDVVRSDP